VKLYSGGGTLGRLGHGKRVRKRSTADSSPSILNSPGLSISSSPRPVDQRGQRLGVRLDDSVGAVGAPSPNLEPPVATSARNRSSSPSLCS
jgi:hypothetical protein